MKMLRTVLVITMALTVAACEMGTAVQKEQVSPNTQTQAPVGNIPTVAALNLDAQPESGRYARIHGRIDVDDKGNVYLVANWLAAAKVTYLVTNPDKDEYTRLASRTMVTKCQVIEQTGSTGKVVIISYILD